MATFAQLRITKDIHELELPETCKIEFSDPDDLLNFCLAIVPDEGFYSGGHFKFSFKIDLKYLSCCVAGFRGRAEGPAGQVQQHGPACDVRRNDRQDEVHVPLLVGQGRARQEGHQRMPLH